MDPNTALTGLRELIAEYQNGSLTRGESDLSTIADNLDAHLGALVTQVAALDGWLTRGGFLPVAWAPEPLRRHEKYLAATRYALANTRVGDQARQRFCYWFAHSDWDDPRPAWEQWRSSHNMHTGAEKA